MQKIILYYLFTPINDPEAIKLWQQSLAASFNLRGRIIIANHGINGTLGGDIKDLKSYVKQTKNYHLFKQIAFKWSDGAREDFPRLSVKIRPELVTFGVPEKIQVDTNGVIGGGKHLKPKQLHELVEKHPDEVVFVDGRNSWEAAIGRFKGAVIMDVDHTRDFPREIANPKYNKLKNKKVVTYCTGGIRCEVLTKLMKDQGYSDVYQLDGGIAKYLETYGDRGLWEGSLYVFDDRIRTRSSKKTKLIGQCVHCQSATDNYVNCANISCNRQILCCKDCLEQTLLCTACDTASVQS